MKLILQAFGRAWMFETTFTSVKVHTLSEADEVSHDHEDEPEDQIRFDPRSTTAAHLERRTDMEDAYGRERNTFGFGHGPAA